MSRITSLRSFLIRAEGGTGRLSTLAFAAGIVGYGLQVVSQAPQVTLTLPGQADRQPESAPLLTDLGYAMVTFANLLAPVVWLVPAVTVMLRRPGTGRLR